MKIALILIAILFVSCANDGFNDPTVIKKYYVPPVGDNSIRYFIKVRTIVNNVPTFKDFEVPIAMYDSYQVDDKVIDWGQQ